MKKLIYLITLCLFSMISYAQTEAPADKQKEKIAIEGATIHVGNGEVIQNGVIAFDNGTITYVGDGTGFDKSGHKTMNASGKHVYPGFIIPDSRIGLEEVGSIKATKDFSEQGYINPNIRSIVAYNTDSELIPTYRFNGIAMAQVSPEGGLVAGTSSVVLLDAWNWEDAAYKVDEGLHVNWPRRVTSTTPESVRKRMLKMYNENIHKLHSLFVDALAYGKQENPYPNLQLSALQGLFSGEQTFFLHANNAVSIMEGISFAQRHGVKKIVLVGSRDVLDVADFLKESDIPVILTSRHSIPSYTEDDLDAPYKLPAELQAKGILVALSYKGLHGGRNLAFTAGTSAAYGLTKEEALATITLNTAKILGIDDRVGSLEKGKDATLFISEGDALDMRTNKISNMFIQGRNTSLHNLQQRLYDKYSKKYGHTQP